VQHVLVHSGQNFDREFNDAIIAVSRIISSTPPGRPPAQTIARMIKRFDEIVAAEKPGAMCMYDVTDMIYDLSVDVLRHALVEATVGGLQLEVRHLVLLLVDTNSSRGVIAAMENSLLLSA
jgi:hypothetical protein